MEIQLRVHVISARKMGSGDRVPVLACGPRRASGLVLVIQIV